MKTRIIITCIAFILVLLQLDSQSSIVALGGDSKGNGGLVSFSVGQIVTGYNKSQNGTVSEGVQNPYEIFIINETDNLMSGLSIYPNPTSDYLILRFIDSKIEATSFELRNIYGQVLEHKDIIDEETYIDMSGFSALTFFLSLKYKNKLLQTFKIIKIEKL